MGITNSYLVVWPTDTVENRNVFRGKLPTMYLPMHQEFPTVPQACNRRCGL